MNMDVKLAWDGNVTNATGYNLYYGYQPGSIENVIRLPNQTTYTLQLWAKSYWYLHVRAMTPAGETGPSNTVEVDTRDTVPPPPPPEPAPVFEPLVKLNMAQVFTKKAGEVADLSWEYTGADAAALTSFNIYRQTGVTSSTSKIVSLLPTARGYGFTVPGGTTRQYRLVIVPVKGASFLPGSAEVLVNRG